MFVLDRRFNLHVDNMLFNLQADAPARQGTPSQHRAVLWQLCLWTLANVCWRKGNRETINKTLAAFCVLAAF